MLRILDTSVDVLRFRFARILAMSALVVVPLCMIPMAIANRAQSGWAGSAEASQWPFFVSVAGISLATSLLGVPMAMLVTRWSIGEDPGVKDGLRVLAGRFGVTLVAWILATLIKGAASMACGIGAWPAIAAFSLVSPVIAAEGAGAPTAIRRSFDLAKRRFGALLGMTFMQGLMSYYLGAGILAGAQQAGRSENPFVSTLGIVVLALPLLVWIPFVAASASLMYLDIRVRGEALDLQLERPRAFPATGGR